MGIYITLRGIKSHQIEYSIWLLVYMSVGVTIESECLVETKKTRQLVTFSYIYIHTYICTYVYTHIHTFK